MRACREAVQMMMLSGGGGGSPYPPGAFLPVSSDYYPEPTGGSTALKRYQWNMDGQDDFWRRSNPDYGTTSTCRLECTWVAIDTPVTGFKGLIGKSAGDRFYILLDAVNNMYFGNGAGGFATNVPPVFGELNHAVIEADGVERNCQNVGWTDRNR